MAQIDFYFCDKSHYDTILVLDSLCKSLMLLAILFLKKKKDFDIFYDYPGLDISSMTARWKFVENSRCWLRKSELCVRVAGKIVLRRHSETNTVQFLPVCLLALRFVFVPLVVSVISYPIHVSVKSYNQQVTTYDLVDNSNILNSFITYLVFLMANFSEN